MSSGNGNVDYYYGEYDDELQGEEEEWDREQLLDPMWEKQQKKTFTAWCNSHLRKVGTQIENIEEDFRNGLKLMLLLEVISSEQLPRPDRGKMRFHKIANVNKALEFIESKGVKLVSMGAEEIVDGNVKMTLGLIWTIILRFAIQDISVEELTAKEGLLLWCQRKTAGYRNVNVQNFHVSWKDGLAFCALIHRHRPDLIDFNRLSKDNPLENLDLAFDVAEKHLDIPRMLDPEDMTSIKPDERSVMAYVSCYYHAFSGAQKAETAANRICKVLKIHQENERLMEEYERLSSDLLEWLRRQIPRLEDRSLGPEAQMSDREALSTARRRLDDFRQYRLGEKPSRLSDKARLETTFNTLQTRLRLANRPAYMPTEGKLVSDIANAWRRLEKAELGFEEWLVAEIERLERLDQLVRKFEHKCAAHDTWAVNCESELTPTSQGIPTSLADVRALRRRHEALESELNAHQDRIDQIARIADELVALRYRDSAGVTARSRRIGEQFDSFATILARRRTELDEAERTLEALDKLQLEFAKRAAPFHTWVEGIREDLEDEIMARSLDEVIALQHAHDTFRATLGDAERELNDLLRIEAEISQLVVFGQRIVGPHGVLRNPYTNITAAQLSQEWTMARELVPARERALGLEAARQQQIDRLRKQFAQIANQVGPWLERQLEQVSAVAVGRGDSLEDQLRKLKQVENATASFRQHMEELERVNEQLQEALVMPLDLAKLTPYTTESLRVGWEQLLTNIARHVNAVENEILTRDAKGISGEQLDELRRSFLHFDRTRSRRLEPAELRACLVSLGQSVQSDDEFRRILATMDPNGLGYVTFDAFLDYMTREIAGEADSADRMIESFRVLAEGRPYISAEELRRELPPDQAEYCTQRMRQYRGPNAPPSALDYNSFSIALYGHTDL